MKQKKQKPPKIKSKWKPKTGGFPPDWQKRMSYDTKPAPPVIIYMVIEGKAKRYRLCTMHNMPVYLPDDEPAP